MEVHPLQNIINTGNYFCYGLQAKTNSGEQFEIKCEFQTGQYFIFRSTTGFLKLGDRISIKANSFHGYRWIPCIISQIDDFPSYSLYQATVLIINRNH